MTRPVRSWLAMGSGVLIAGLSAELALIGMAWGAALIVRRFVPGLA